MTPQRNKELVLAALAAHPFRPARWLPGGHAQTVAGRYLRPVPALELRRERWTTPDDDFVDVHFLDGDPNEPTVLLLHGLEGCARSAYIGAMLACMQAVDWNGAVLEFRSCSGQINRQKRMYHSGETTDAAWVVRELIARNPRMVLFICGYSLGGNVTAKWLGDEADTVPDNVRAAAVVSAPYDLLTSGIHMDRSLSLLYVRHFLKSLVPKAIEKERQFPGCLDADRVRRSRTFNDFDTFATAPLHGFVDARDYYTSVACGQFLEGIRVPVLLLSSADDPFNPGTTLPHAVAAASPWLHPLFTRRGGHVGFLQQNGRRGLDSWAESQILRFFRFYARD